MVSIRPPLPATCLLRASQPSKRRLTGSEEERSSRQKFRRIEQC
jgi:hypothetical protein